MSFIIFCTLIYSVPVWTQYGTNMEKAFFPILLLTYAQLSKYDIKLFTLLIPCLAINFGKEWL